MKRNPAAPIQHLIFPVLFRLLYSCGLRPSEALTLASRNVDLKTGVLFVEQSKGHADRNVVVSDDMLHILRNYRRKSLYCGVARTLFFFPICRAVKYRCPVLIVFFGNAGLPLEFPTHTATLPEFMIFGTALRQNGCFNGTKPAAMSMQCCPI